MKSLPLQKIKRLLFQKMTTKKYIKLILILGSLTALGPFSIDMYLPGFSDIAKDFNERDLKEICAIIKEDMKVTIH